MKGKIVSMMLCCLLISVSCQKQPVAGFKTDKTTYVAGETINITNTTTDGSGDYSWGFASSQINAASTDVNPTLIIPENHPDGELGIALKASSSNGKKSSEASLTVNIVAATGNAIFWQSTGSGFGTTTVTISGNTSVIASEYPSAPSCGASGCAVFSNWKVGTYNYTATDGTSNWNGSVTITKNGCAKKQLL